MSAPDNPKPNKHKTKKMLKAFNFIVIRPLKLHIIMYSSFPTFLDCGSDIMWRHYEIIIAEFFTEPTGEPTGNRKVERIHSVNFFNRRFKKSVKKLPKTDRSLSVLSESDDSKWMVQPKKGAYPLSCVTTSKLEMSSQDSIIFKGPKCVISGLV